MVLEAYQKALMVEKQQAARTFRKKNRDEQNNKGHSSDSRQTTNQTLLNQENQRAIGQGFSFRLCCFRCGEVRHRINECRKPESHLGKNMLV
jgi:hypothetical protein